MTTKIQHLIGGAATGTPEVERRNPFDDRDVVTVSPRGTSDDVVAAIDAAQAAQPGWAAQTAPARGAILDRASQILRDRADDVARDLVREEGKTFAEARGETQRAIDLLRYYGAYGWHLAGQVIPSAAPGTTIHTRREPVGVCGIITPWNFPIAIPAWKMLPALISGNSVVLKPAELTGLTAWNLVQALVDAGLPGGVVNVVHGQGSVVGEALVRDDRVAAVSFTGSTTVGRRIHDMVSVRMGRVQLEMGGKNPIVVTARTDLDHAADVVAASAFSLTGQACTAASRVIGPPQVLADLEKRLSVRASAYAPGNGLDEGVLMGPAVSAEQCEQNERFVSAAEADGAVVAVDGRGLDGQLFGPTVVGGVESDSIIAQEEIFGPVLTLLEAADFDQAIEIANGTPFGLAAGICTNDLGEAHAFSERIQAGVVKVNRPTVGLELNVPFGGTKASSTGTFREQGETGVDFYTWTKSVYTGAAE